MTSTESETAADLKQWIERLSRAARDGTTLELAGSGSVDPAQAGKWGPDRCIPAAALRHVLTLGETMDPRGLRISGARFCGELDLAHIVFPYPLHLEGCALGAPINLRGAALKELSFSGSHTDQVRLDRAQINGDVFADGLEAGGEFFSVGVHIGGQLNLREAKLRNGGDALILDGAQISGGLFAGGCEADGLVRALQAHIGGQLDLREAKLRNGGGMALALDGAQITGDVFANRFEVDGEARAEGLHIDGALDLSEAKLRNGGGTALMLDGAQITGNVSAKGCEVDGTVRALAAHIGGQLNLTGAKLCKCEGMALMLDGAQITGDVLFANLLQADGEVHANGIRIGGQLNVREAKLGNGGGDALTLDGAEITGSVRAEGCEADGEVHALGAHIGGELNLIGAKLRNGGGDALSLDGAEISGGVLAGGCEADGAVRAVHAHIGGQLHLGEAKLRNGGGMALILNGAQITGDVLANRFEVDGEARAEALHIDGALGLSEAKLRNGGGTALMLDRAQITGNLSAKGCEADGTVRAPGAHIGGQLDLSGAKLRNGGDNVLNLESASIKLLILRRVDHEGEVDLAMAEITDLLTDANPPEPLVATGWEVSDIHGPLRSDLVAARRWLETTTETSVQPWHALAAVYERNGQPAEGRRLRFAAANRVAKNAPWRTKLMLITYRYLVGHGYYPLRAFWWLVGVLLVATFIVATNRADFVPTKSEAAEKAANAYTAQTHKPVPSRITAQESCQLRLDYPCLNPFTYTVSAVVPNFGNMTSDWAIPSDATNWLTIALPMLKLTAWALTALLGAGVTGILRKT